MKSFSPNRYPPGGFSFTDTDGVEFVGDSVGKLAAKLMEYRETNGFPPGSPVAEVHAQLCEKFPDMCVEALDADVAIDGQQLVRRVVISTKGLLRDRQLKVPLLFVAPDVASRREDVCMSCPHNVNWKILCMPCQDASGPLLAALVAPRQPRKELSGRCCNITGDDLSVAVWIDGPSVVEMDVDCWRKSSPPVDTEAVTTTHQ